MNNRNTRENDVVYTRQIKRKLDFGTGLLWIVDCGMRGILMSIFTDFIAFKSSLFKCNRNNFWFGKYQTSVYSIGDQ